MSVALQLSSLCNFCSIGIFYKYGFENFCLLDLLVEIKLSFRLASNPVHKVTTYVVPKGPKA